MEMKVFGSIFNAKDWLVPNVNSATVGAYSTYDDNTILAVPHFILIYRHYIK